MNKAQALQAFWSSFGIPAVDEQSSYDDATFNQLGITYPYLTYESATSSFDDTMLLGADLWYQSTSWAGIEEKAQQISEAIGLGGIRQTYTDGCLWITRGLSFSRRMPSDATNSIRRIHLNINAEFQSA